LWSICGGTKRTTTLATRRDAGKELEFAAELINRIVKGIDGRRIGVHVCRGNWGKQEDVLLTGDYAKTAAGAGANEN
jgi:methionine synthase II (cobalamin-independent)